MCIDGLRPRRLPNTQIAQLLRTPLSPSFSLTHNAVAVAVSHILIRGMTARHRRDAVRAGFGAGDTAVVIVVVQLQRVVALARLPSSAGPRSLSQ